MTTTKLEELQELIDSKKEEAAKAKGKLEDILSRLAEDFEVGTIDEAKDLLTALEKEVQKLDEKEEVLDSEIADLLEEIED